MRKPIHLSLSITLMGIIVACSHTPIITNGSTTYQASNAKSTQSRFYDTAKNGLTWAEFDARRWDISADLVKVESRQVDEDGRSWDWLCYFTSPFQKNALVVDSKHQSYEVSKLFFGDEFSDFNWHVDSKQALEIAKKNGLQHFPVHRMELEERFTLEWTISSSDGFFRINAETGEVSRK